MNPAPQQPAVRQIGRYALHGEIAAGGMATVHVGRLIGPVGFTRTVAIKRLHAQFAKDPEFVSMFLDEARLAGRIQHPNVCSTLDVVATNGELFLVMEYLQGETLSRLIRGSRALVQDIPAPIVVAVIAGALRGLHAAHEAHDERGEPLHIVHRDISPQNILIDRDGIPKILDFGVAKAAGRFHTTREGNVKGKLPYMSPEQLRGQAIDRRTDIYAAFVCAWEALTGRKLFRGENEGSVLTSVLEGVIAAPSALVATVPAALDAVVMQGLSRDPTRRFATAKDAASALERVVRPALAAEVAEWVELVAGEALNRQAERVAEIESRSGALPELSAILSGLADAAFDAPTRVAPVQVPPEAIPPGTLTALPPSEPVPTHHATPSPAREPLEPSAGSQAPKPVTPRRTPSVAVVAAVVAVLGIAALWMTSRRTDSAGPGSLPSASVAASVPAPGGSTAAPSASAAAAASASVAASAPAASPSAPPVALGRAPSKPPPAASTTAARAPVDCSPPYRVGPNGEKIYKRECM